MNPKVSINLLRIAGLIAAIGAAVHSAMSGDYATAGGLVGAALSAAGLKGKASVTDAN